MSRLNTEMFRKIARHYDLLNSVISAGQDHHWRNTLVFEALHASRNLKFPALDIASGTGQVSAKLKSSGVRTVIAFDPCVEMHRVAALRERGASGRVLGRSEELPFPNGSLGMITCAFGIRNFEDRRRALREWHRVLCVGGVAAILEIHPEAPVWYAPAIGWYWRHVVPAIGRLGSHGRAYEVLRDSVDSFVSRELLQREAEAAGLRCARWGSLVAGGWVAWMILKRHE